MRAEAMLFALGAGALALPVAAQDLPAPLTDRPGDVAAGRAIVTDQTRGLCVLCHSGPFDEVPFMGTLGPDLSGVGARMTEAELRQRMIDSRAINPDTIMPPYYSTEGLDRVGPEWDGESILAAQEIEDVVAFLASLDEGASP